MRDFYFYGLPNFARFFSYDRLPKPIFFFKYILDWWILQIFPAANWWISLFFPVNSLWISRFFSHDFLVKLASFFFFHVIGAQIKLFFFSHDRLKVFAKIFRIWLANFLGFFIRPIDKFCYTSPRPNNEIYICFPWSLNIFCEFLSPTTRNEMKGHVKNGSKEHWVHKIIKNGHWAHKLVKKVVRHIKLIKKGRQVLRLAKLA